jgi:septum formation protein
MLDAAGIACDVVPADIDEAALRRQHLLARPGSGDTAGDIARMLAKAKAEDVSRRHPQAVVIGADQVLALEGDLFSKPDSAASARRDLLRLRGRTHTLHSAVALARGGKTDWSHVATASLTMRAFSDQYLDRYLERCGPAVQTSVGAYQIEGPGIGLFERVEGDYFTIIGLPLLPLLAELRRRGIVLT